METLSFPKTMGADEVTTLAEKFAYDMVEKLNKFNEEFPTPELSNEDSQYVKKTIGDSTPDPFPKEFIDIFQHTFILYVSSRYLIVP